METLSYFILVTMVRAAFAVFIVGTLIRLVKIFRSPKHPTTLQIYPEKRPKWLFALYDTFFLPTVMRHNFSLWIFLMAFHGAVLLLIIGHLELFKEFEFFQIIPHQVFIGQGFVGITAFVSLLYFLFRRFVSPNRDLSVPEDYYLLILLLLIVIFGSEMDLARRWYGYGEMTVEDYRTYLFSLLTLTPVLPQSVTSSGHSFMLLLHVFFANLFLIFFPFSKIMHSFLALPMNKLRRG